MKHLLNDEDAPRNMRDDYCSETETEGGGISEPPDACESSEVSKPDVIGPNMSCAEKSDDLVLLAKLTRRGKNSSKIKMSPVDAHDKEIDTYCNSGQASSRDLHKSCYNLQSVGRKRIRVVISDDEGEPDDMDQMRMQFHDSLIEEVGTSDKG